MDFNKFSGWCSVLGLIFAVVGFFPTTNCIHMIFVSLTCLVFVVLFCYNLKQGKTMEKYLKGEEKIRNLHNKLLLEGNNIQGKTFDRIVSDLTSICTELSEAFEIIKGEKIGVCIKYANGEIENPYVKTLCRDAYSKNKRSKLDKNNDKDYILQNTDFLHILTAIQQEKDFTELFYLENDLANKHQYQNTHLKKELSSGFFSYFKRRKEWPLPYQSTIVIPFIPIDGNELDGFLCIDSPSPNCFNKERDVVILQEVALFMRELIYVISHIHLINR